MSQGRNFHMTAKPIGATCNMKCTYCYFLSKAHTLNSRSQITDDTLETFIQNYIEAQDSDTVFFTWHGGEPTLCCIDFFKRVIELQQKHAGGKFIENDLQTNGLLLDDDWCRFLKDNHFLVGLSVDGDAIANAHRIDTNGNATLDRVIKSSELLRKHEIPFNTLTVVNNNNMNRPLETYRFLRDTLGSTHMQFIPLVEIKNHAHTAPLHWNETPEIEPYSVTPTGWGEFLLGLFDEWYQNDQGKTFIYLFENFLSLWLNLGPQMCVFEKNCGHALALDRDGSVYACDHFCYPEYKYGNLNEQPLKEIASSSKRHSFSNLKSQLPHQCQTCEWLNKCRGECPKKRFLKTDDGEMGLNYLCAGYKLFFKGANARLLELCQKYG